MSAVISLFKMVSGIGGETGSIEITDRPVIISIPWPTNRYGDMKIIADMETCIAAAFFESGV